MTRSYETLLRLLGIAAILGAFSMVLWRRARCGHPNPHYVRPTTAHDATGRTVTVEPARYICYECGQSWVARQRDPAWHPTAIIQRFSGYDPRKAAQAAVRAEAEHAQRRQIAGNRARPAAPAAGADQRRQKEPVSVVNIKSRKPA
jgi:hypothetical protein